MTYEVTIKNIPTKQVLSLTHHIKVDKLDRTIRQSLDTFQTLLTEQNTSPSEAPFGIFHGPINMQEDGPIEICQPVAENIATKGEVTLKELAGGQAACVMMVGKQTDFPEILNGYDTAADWIQKNGYEMTEPPREVWHAGNGPDARMEIVWLFK